MTEPSRDARESMTLSSSRPHFGQRIGYNQATPCCGWHCISHKMLGSQACRRAGRRWVASQQIGRVATGEYLSHRQAKHQAPNPKLQRSSGIETPKTKIQTPKKSQVPSSKPLPALRAWNLELEAS